MWMSLKIADYTPFEICAITLTMQTIHTSEKILRLDISAPVSSGPRNMGGRYLSRRHLLFPRSQE
jgi:hypothetical protein